MGAPWARARDLPGARPGPRAHGLEGVQPTFAKRKTKSEQQLSAYDVDVELSIRLVWPFVELVRPSERDALVKQLSVELGLTPAQFAAPETRVPLQAAADLLSEFVDRTGRRNLGLLAARHVTSEHLGVTEYLARSKGTLGEALQSWARCTRLLFDGGHVRFELKPELVCVRLWLDSQLVIHGAAYEFALAVWLYSVRRITRNPEFAPSEAHFTCPQPEDSRLHEHVFKCKLRFDMPVTQVVLPAKALALPLASAETTLARFLEQQANASLAQLPSSDNYVSRVREILSAALDLNGANASQIARRLGVSVRTLARRLERENSSFRMLLDETRKALALRDLSQTQRPINEISIQLGFSNRQSFHRAFRRWTGSTAMTYRESARQRRSA